jgi:hypothetical protein
MHFYWFVLGALAVWRITHLLNAEDGPRGVLVRIRGRLGTGLLGDLVDCFYCLSVWIAAPVAYFIGEGVGERLLLWAALSGAACLLERVTMRAESAPALYVEDAPSESGMEREVRDVLR